MSSKKQTKPSTAKPTRTRAKQAPGVYQAQIDEAANNVTPESIAAVVAAIKNTGPRVDNIVYRAHVPAYVTRRGEIVAELANEIVAGQHLEPVENVFCPHLTAALKSIAELGEVDVPEIETQPSQDLFAEIRKSAEFEPLIAAYLTRNWKHFRAHAAALMGDFDPEFDCNVGEPESLVDRFFTLAYDIQREISPGYPPSPTTGAILVVGLVVTGDAAPQFNPLTPENMGELVAGGLGK